MSDTMSHTVSTPNDPLNPLYIASNSSTLPEALNYLIEKSKTSPGRSDLASKQILPPLLKLCQSPHQLPLPGLLLSLKLLRNLCAGEIVNQNLFIELNGVGILSTLVSTMGLCSGPDEGLMLRTVLQVLGNVALAGKEHCLVVWREFFPLGFLDVARVRNKDVCDPLCMVLYTCYDGSDGQASGVFADRGLDIIVEIIRTVAIAGFKEDWVLLLLSRICLEESHFPSVFSKLSPVVAASENSDDTRIIHFGDDQAFVLSILSEVLSQQAGELVVSSDFALCIFRILRNAVGIVDFSTRGKLPLPTASADTNVLGYTLSILRDIIACDAPKVSSQAEKQDLVDMLVSDGLIKLLIAMLRDLEPPQMIKKAMTHNEAEGGKGSNFSKYCPYRGFRRDVIAIIGNCSYRRKRVQDELREEDGIVLVLQQCVTDEDNPFLREWGFWSMRNILEGNMENQEFVAKFQLQKSVDIPEIAALGLRVEVDPQTRRAKLVNHS